MTRFLQSHLKDSGATMPERIETAVERLRLHEPEEGYWLADSYGKDSCCILELARIAGDTRKTKQREDIEGQCFILEDGGTS